MNTAQDHRLYRYRSRRNGRPHWGAPTCDLRQPLFLSVLLFAFGGASALIAAPIGLHDRGGRGAVSHDAEFARALENAIDLVRDQARTAPACLAYFKRLGIDLDAWLAPGVPPYVVAKRLNTPSRRSIEPVCGGAQGQPPFEVLFVDKRCFRQPQICDLASLILHEIGHLARRDTRDNEPPGFFAACRLSVCVDPARYN